MLMLGDVEPEKGEEELEGHARAYKDHNLIDSIRLGQDTKGTDRAENIQQKRRKGINDRNLTRGRNMSRGNPREKP